MGFNNTDAAICGGIALTELIFFIFYVSVMGRKLRQKIISMGRLIPTVPVVVVGGVGVTSGVTVVQGGVGMPNPYQNPQTNYNPTMQQPGFSAPPPGFHQHQDLPPPYSQVKP